MSLLDVVKSPAQNEKCKAAILPKYPNGKSACGATASWYLRAAGVFGPHEDFPWAEDVGKRLDELGWTLIVKPSQVRAGDVIFAEDSPYDNNESTDHVFISASDAGDAPKYGIICLDNQEGFRPHLRNLGGGPKTPFWYAYRAPEPMPQFSNGAEILAAFRTLYRLPLSDVAMRKLNELRHLPEFKGIK